MPSQEQPTPTSSSTIILSLIAIFISILFITFVIPIFAPPPLIEDRQVYQTASHMDEIETTIEIDGKKHRIKLQVPVQYNTAEKVRVELPQTMTRTDTFRIIMICGVAALLGLWSFYIFIACAYFSWKSKKAPPAYFHKQQQYLIAVLVSLFVGFIGGQSVSYEPVRSEKPSSPNLPSLQEPKKSSKQ